MKTKLAGMGGAPAQTYVDDVFSTYLYTGNGSTQTITNGIDLAGKGGMVWIRDRGAYANYDHKLTDTDRGVGKPLSSNANWAQLTENGLTAFNSTGFNVALANNNYNVNAIPFASWTFRKAAKFFDVVTYTGTGSARTIAHSLGVAPGMVIVKQTNSAGAWAVYHRGAAASGQTAAGSTLFLNTTAAVGAATIYWNNTAPTDSVFSVGTNSTTNGAGQTYVAYLFAHDTSSDGIIQCGSFNSAGGQYTLGWEPQYLLIKRTDAVEDWQIYDTMRGWTTDGIGARLVPNTAAAESSGGIAIAPTATGFNATSGASKTYIYMAIRRPNKPPTSGTQVFSPISTTSATGTKLTTDFVVDAQIFAGRNIAGHNTVDMSRLTGVSTNATESGNNLITNTTDAEAANNFSLAWDNTGFKICSGFGGGNVIYWNFKRAPGFFDVVCYTGTGVATTQAHNLGVVPELMIVKNRTGAGRNWAVYTASTGVNALGLLDLTNAFSFGVSNYWDTLPTLSVFSIGTEGRVNLSGNTYVAYLFATLAGISKVGSYTGNGTTQNIECGFAAGARFVLIKRTDSTGDWYVWDTARGIVSANDPHLSLNTTAAEVTTDDSVDPYSAGFAVNQVAATNINVSSATYIFLAIA